jgi:acyl carrier protein
MDFARLRLAARNLRLAYIAPGMTGNGNGWTRDRLAELIHRILRDDLLAPDGEFSTKSNLIEAGLDSLAVTQLMLAIEEATGVWTDESLLTPENLETAETLAASIYEYVSRC